MLHKFANQIKSNWVEFYYLIAPADQKVAEAIEPRNLEEEGFYVGVRPEVSDRNKNKMENRLLRQPDKVRDMHLFV